MKTQMIAAGLLLAAILFAQCAQEKSAPGNAVSAVSQAQPYGGFGSQVKWGEHIITVSACHDCHTPKKMTAMGPVLDSTRMLSGHPAGMPAPQVDRAELERKGLTVTETLTAWVGPWGISYAANLTPDDTGTGAWTEAQFMNAIRHGKLKGLDGSRNLLPPMPWEVYQYMTDDELKAIYAYLRTVKPIQNVVPAPEPPLAALISAK